MYVARQPLQLGTRRVVNGDPVPEAEKWDYPVLQAHLRLGWLEKVEGPDPVTPAEVQPAAKATTPRKRTRTKPAA